MYKKTTIVKVRTVDVKIFGEKLKVMKIYFADAASLLIPRDTYDYMLCILKENHNVRYLKGIQAYIYSRPFDGYPRELDVIVNNIYSYRFGKELRPSYIERLLW